MAGIIGVIASVTSRGTPVMSSFAAAIGWGGQAGGRGAGLPRALLPSGAGAACAGHAACPPPACPCLTAEALPPRLDAPVEIVNMQELRAMEQFGVPFFACNLSVGLSVSISGFGLKVAEGRRRGRGGRGKSPAHPAHARNPFPAPAPPPQACWVSSPLPPSALWGRRLWRRPARRAWRAPTPCSSSGSWCGSTWRAAGWPGL